VVQPSIQTWFDVEGTRPPPLSQPYEDGANLEAEPPKVELKFEMRLIQEITSVRA